MSYPIIDAWANPVIDLAVSEARDKLPLSPI
jgi:hypothetical protein